MTIAAIAATLAVLAQFTAEEDPTGVLNFAWPFLAVAIPFVVSRLTSEAARSRLKFGVAAGLAVLVSVVTLLGMEWPEPAEIPMLLLSRAGNVLALALATYHTVDAFYERFTGDDMNSQRAFAPERGIG